MPDPRERLTEHLEEALGDADLPEAMAGMMVDDARWHGVHGRPGFAAGRAGDFIIAGASQADVTEIIDVVDGTADSLADSAKRSRCRRAPRGALSFTYLNGAAILDAVGEQTLQKLQAMMSPAEQAVWQTHSGLAVSAVEPGFRVDAITVPGESGTPGPPPSPMIRPSSPPRSGSGRHVPLPSRRGSEDAFAGAAYMLALAVNGEMADEGQGDGLNQLPSEEEIEEEIATASATLGFDPRSELFDLLGGEFIAFSSFPTFDMNGFGLDAVAAATTTDPDTLAETARKIAAAIERSGLGADVSVRDVDGDTIYVVSDPEMAEGPSLEFGVVDDQAVVGTGGGDRGPGDRANLIAGRRPAVQAVMEFLPSEYYQVAYVDIGQAVDVLTAMFGQWTEVLVADAGAATPGPATGAEPGEHPGARGGLLPTGRGGRIERDPLHRGASVLT